MSNGNSGPEFEIMAVIPPTGRGGKEIWHKVGVAFPFTGKDNKPGFTLKLNSLPHDWRELVMRPPFERAAEPGAEG